jgi:hypothetical protein
MAYFAEINKDNMVVRVVVVPDEQIGRGQDFLAKELGLGGTWIQTDRPLAAGENKVDVISLNKTTARKNFADVGHVYDKAKDAFIPPMPKSGDWTLNETTCKWEVKKKI